MADSIPTDPLGPEEDFSHLPDDSFGLKKERLYPVHTKNHAITSLEKVHKFGTPKDQILVKAAVHRKFPQLHAFSFKPKF